MIFFAGKFLPFTMKPKLPKFYIYGSAWAADAQFLIEMLLLLCDL